VQISQFRREDSGGGDGRGRREGGGKEERARLFPELTKVERVNENVDDFEDDSVGDSHGERREEV